MALAAGDLNMSPRELKSGLGMIEYCLLPAFCRMAGCTILSKLALMDIILAMTACAIFWGALEYSLLMTFLTLDPYMSAGKWKSRLRMIKKRIRPSISGVAGLAIPPQWGLVRVVIVVTFNTGLRRIT